MKIESGYQDYQKKELPQAKYFSDRVDPTTVKHAETKSVNYDLSETTKNLQKTGKTLQESPIDTEKIAALKAAIKDGSYKVDATALAKKMLATDE